MSAQLDRVAEELEGRSLRPFWPKWRYIELYLGGKLEVAFGSFLILVSIRFFATLL